jgi:hypothetical protein
MELMMLSSLMVSAVTLEREEGCVLVYLGSGDGVLA